MMMEDNILDNIPSVGMAKVYLAFQTEMYTWDPGNRISLMVKECTYILMGSDIKENS
jgi:hypothetical protein